MREPSLQCHEAAAEAAGNWQQWDQFYWAEFDGAEDWTIWLLETKQSLLHAQANAIVIRERMKEFQDDVMEATFGHPLQGECEALIVRVYDAEGQVTHAFETMWRINNALKVFEVLDEDIYKELRDEQATEHDDLSGDVCD